MKNFAIEKEATHEGVVAALVVVVGSSICPLSALL
jgi:hypothetical protein